MQEVLEVFIRTHRVIHLEIIKHIADSDIVDSETGLPFLSSQQ